MELGQKNLCPVCSPSAMKKQPDRQDFSVSDEELEKISLFLIRHPDTWNEEFDSFYDELKPADGYEDFYAACREGVEILSALREILSGAEVLTGELVIKIREMIPARFPSVSADRARQLARIVFSASKESKGQPAGKKASPKAAPADRPALSEFESVLDMPEARIRLALHLARRVESLNLSGYTLGILKEKNIDNIYELCTKTESQLKECGFGAKALASIEDALRKNGLHTEMTFNPEFSEAVKTTLENKDQIRLALLLADRVESLSLSEYILGVLKGANIGNIYELCTRTESQLKEYCDVKLIDVIGKTLAEYGLHLGMTFDSDFSQAVEILLGNVARIEEEKRDILSKLRDMSLKKFYSLLKFCALEAGTIKPDTDIADAMDLNLLFPQVADKEKVLRRMNRFFQTRKGGELTINTINYFSAGNPWSPAGWMRTVSDLKKHLCDHALLDAEELLD